MKTIISILIFSICLTSTLEAQKGRKHPRRSRSRSAASQSAASTASADAGVIGMPVTIVTRNGDTVTGGLVELAAATVRVKSDKGESTIRLTDVSSLSFGATQAAGQSGSGRHPEFEAEAGAILGSFQSIGAAAKSDPEYTEYGRQLVELRRKAERFIDKYGASEDGVETRTAALAAGALTDYTWARTIWTLKLGRAGGATVSAGDSPAVADAAELYPDLKAAAASGPKLSADKLIAGLWKKAAEKVERIRPLAGQSR